MILFRLSALMMVLALSMETASAFPTWMGVYDYHQRHDGGNPGRFVILMNQSYVGLEANVGYRVNGGTWSEYPMSYVTDVDGNSVWEYLPAQPFPFDATVEFYFHGYDTDPANNIYDSRDTQNYFSGPLQWKAKEIFPMYSVFPANNLQPTAYATADEVMYLVYAYPGINTNVTFARKFPGRDWEWFLTLGQDFPYNDFDLAADGALVAFTYRVNMDVYVKMSADRGDTWGAAVPIVQIPSNGTLTELNAAANGDGAFAIAYGIATNCCGAKQISVTVSTNDGFEWSNPVTAVELNTVNEFASGIKLAGNKQGWHLAVRNVIESGGEIMIGASSSNGVTWTQTPLGRDDIMWMGFDLAVGAHTAVIAADPHDQSNTFVWRSAPGGTWTTQTISRAMESGSQIWLGTDGRDTFHLFRFEDNDASPSASTYLPSYRTSSDGGTTWSAYPLPIDAEKPGSNNFITLRRVISTGPVQHLVWEHNDYVTMFQRMYSLWMQDSSGYTETLAVTPQSNGQIMIDATNLTAGMTHQLEVAPAADSTTWSNIATWSHGTTNIVVSPAGEGGVYRVKSSY